ncbi:MAG: tRNA uridine-5-carboxymethylaminomethyl(34) synthesis GTPase MnmE, partial [Candidatus Methylacidiphilales bacterium]
MPDTIVASATPPIASALAVVRLSGDQAFRIAEHLSGHRPRAGNVRYCTLTHNGTHLDDAVVLSWRGPASFTGEDTVEFSCHGNPLIVQQLIGACCSLGARPAEPGEFTRRAFLNGKMDLTRAEAVADLIHARTQRALHAAHAFQKGSLGQRISGAQESLLDILAHLEAHIDFPDEDIQPEVGHQLTVRVQQLIDLCNTLLESAHTGHFLRHGITVVLVGAPNSGKSSLMNALLGEERVLVSPLPGTTRDSIEAQFTLDGIACRLVDTAGLRDSDD